MAMEFNYYIVIRYDVKQIAETRLSQPLSVCPAFSGNGRRDQFATMVADFLAGKAD